MSSGLLVAASEEDLDDLVIWLTDHPDEVPAEARLAAELWLSRTIIEITSYPAVIVVPTEHVAAINGVIDDWAEILSAHDEPFHTHTTDTLPP